MPASGGVLGSTAGSNLTPRHEHQLLGKAIAAPAGWPHKPQQLQGTGSSLKPATPEPCLYVWPFSHQAPDGARSFESALRPDACLRTWLQAPARALQAPGQLPCPYQVPHPLACLCRQHSSHSARVGSSWGGDAMMLAAIEGCAYTMLHGHHCDFACTCVGHMVREPSALCACQSESACPKLEGSFHGQLPWTPKLGLHIIQSDPELGPATPRQGGLTAHAESVDNPHPEWPEEATHAELHALSSCHKVKMCMHPSSV